MNAVPYVIPQCGTLAPLQEEFDDDPRGILWMFEPPHPGGTYYMGVDPTRGIVNWDRRFRNEADGQTDNGVIEVIRRGMHGAPDRQVAEYAAPIDAEDLGDVANAIGRLYGGNNEDGQAKAIIEVWPGPGEPTQRRMITHYGYTNLYVPVRYANTLAPEYGKNQVGWISNDRSRRDLWVRGTKHIIQRKIKLYSPWLIEEMADCQADDWMYRETARARWGKHDDRVVAILLAIYAAHDWSFEVETVRQEISQGKVASWQASDMTADGLQDAWEERYSQLLED